MSYSVSLYKQTINPSLISYLQILNIIIPIKQNEIYFILIHHHNTEA